MKCYPLILHSSLCKLFPSKAAQYTLYFPILETAYSREDLRIHQTIKTAVREYEQTIVWPRIRKCGQPVAKEVRPVAKRYLSSICKKIFKNQLFYVKLFVILFYYI
jgi:hypothetical protein